MKKLKFDTTLVKEVRLNMIPKKNWLKVRTKKSDIKCQNCGREFKDLDTNIALMTITGSTNKHLCEECGRRYIEAGAEDVEAKIKEKEKVLNDLKSEIDKIGLFNYKENSSEEDLRTILNKSIEQQNKNNEIKENMKNYPEGLDEYEVVMLMKIDSDENLTEDELSNLVWEFNEVDLEYGENRRWSRSATSIIEIGRRYFQVDWENGLTESQPNEFYNQPVEVEKVTYEKTITVTEWKAIKK